MPIPPIRRHYIPAHLFSNINLQRWLRQHKTRLIRALPLKTRWKIYHAPQQG